ncbi:MAG: hypothetical protein OXU41_01305 [Gammaproteobacteria bacterium]|nr:hypothetical protein [Gammaproteobacteria bacterium]MDD9870158.1 hypothetical protein [Gammaproteobacteria bacterium]
MAADKPIKLSRRITLPPHLDKNDFFAVVDHIAPRAIAREIYRHKIAGRGIVVERDGKVVHLKPEEIEVDEALLRDPSDSDGAGD